MLEAGKAREANKSCGQGSTMVCMGFAEQKKGRTKMMMKKQRHDSGPGPGPGNITLPHVPSSLIPGKDIVRFGAFLSSGGGNGQDLPL